jgi:hypothetical protein
MPEQVESVEQVDAAEFAALAKSYRRFLEASTRGFASSHRGVIARALDQSYGDDGPVFALEEAIVTALGDDVLNPSPLTQRLMHELINWVYPGWPPEDRRVAPSEKIPGGQPVMYECRGCRIVVSEGVLNGSRECYQCGSPLTLQDIGGK